MMATLRRTSPMGAPYVIVPDDIRKCVAFIGTMKDGRFLPRATGFFATYEHGGLRFMHLVTAEHVISGLLTQGHHIYFRVNLDSGETGEIPIPPHVWKFHPDESQRTDVAVCPFSDIVTATGGTTARIDCKTICVKGEKAIPALESLLKEKQIGVGEEVVITGLFRSHYGHERNIPIVRVGNIAMLKGEPVHTEYAGYIQAHLVEARSIGGLSGSPVFINMAPFRMLGSQIIQTSGPRNYLFGLVHGHFDIQKLNEDAVVDDPRDATRGINTGVGVVIPVEKIIETIEHPDLSADREEAVRRKRREGGAIADVADVDAGELATTDENPRHKEDFTTLLNAAARKKPPAE